MKKEPAIPILLCCPDFQKEHGGVQQFSRLFASALKASPLTQSLEILNFSTKSGPASKARYLIRCAKATLQRPRLCIYTHVGLARSAPLFRFMNIPYWVCSHGIECWNLRRKQEASALSGADRILAVSQHTRDRLIQLLPALAEKIVLFPNHVETFPVLLTPKKEARALLNLPANCRLLLTVSRLRHDRYKGHREIIAALNALGPAYGNVHYAIGGGGEDLSELKKETAGYNLSGRIHFLGPLTDSNRSLAYDACDAFVMPSTGEGFGIVFLEAMAHGKPVLAGSVDGSVDALQGYPCGILVNPRDPCSVASGLTHLLHHLEKGNSDWHPEKLRSHIRKNFGLGRLQERVNDQLGLFIRRKNSCAA